MAPWETYLDDNHSRFQRELLDFLRIPSISALPAHAADVQRGARWVAERLQAAGIEAVAIMPTGGHPVVYGEWLRAPGKPTIMIYGHAADHWGNQAAAAVLAETYGTPPYYARVGGSIPVCELFLSTLGAYTVSFAFGLEDEQAHAPNEFFRLHSFRQAPVAYGQLFSRLAQQTVTLGQT